jgi:hypothetical protein
MPVVYVDVVLQIGSALAQAVSRRSVNGPFGIRGARSGSKTVVVLGMCCGLALSVAHHQCSINHLYLNSVFLTRTSGRSGGTFEHNHSLPKAEERLIENYFLVVSALNIY